MGVGVESKALWLDANWFWVDTVLQSCLYTDLVGSMATEVDQE